MFRFIRKKIVEGIIKDAIKELPKYKEMALLYFAEHKADLVEKVIEFIQKEVLKKFVVIAGIIVLGLMPVYAEEVATQELVKENNKATITFLKQPTNQNNSQKVVVKGNWFCINIVNNGKTPFDTSSNK